MRRKKTGSLVSNGGGGSVNCAAEPMDLFHLLCNWLPDFAIPEHHPPWRLRALSAACAGEPAGGLVPVAKRHVPPCTRLQEDVPG